MNFRPKHLAFLLLALPLIGSKCDQGILFKDITPTDLAAPIEVAVDAAAQRAYVINSNNAFEFTSTHLTVLDITDPAAPVILNHANNPFVMPNFSTLTYLDTANHFLYTPNRESDDENDHADSLLKINIDEASAGFGAIETIAGGENPFGISCCDAAGRFYVVSSGGDDDGTLDVYDPNDLTTFTQLSLDVIDSSGDRFTGELSTESIFLGSQAFVVNQVGNVYVINTAEVGDTSKNPIDYLIKKGKELRGIATDGSLLYVVDAREDDGEGLPAVRVLDPSSLVPVSPDAFLIQEVDIESIQTALIPVGKDPNEVEIFKGKAYVTNSDDDTITVIDLGTKSVVTTITVGDEPFGMTAFTAANNSDYLYVSNLRGNSITIIDPATNTVLNTFHPGND